MVQHLLPGRVKLPVVLLQEPLLGQGDGFLCCPQNLSGSLKVLGGLLGLQLGLGDGEMERLDTVFKFLFFGFN